MAEAQREHEVVNSPEAQALLDRVIRAVWAYSDFLERHDLIWEHYEGNESMPRMKASSLVITCDYGQAGVLDIRLKNGPLDRAYGNGTNPDPLGRGPSDIPHRPRIDE